jgi:hypothetical protein
MRKIVLIGLVLVALLVALPGAVAAANSDTIVVSGNIGGDISVSITGDVTFGAMTPGNTYTDTTTDLSVSSTFPLWTVTATDQNAGADTGKMLSGTTPLTNPFQINKNGGAYQGLPYNAILTGSAGTTSADIGFQQQIVSGDLAGSYSITVVFTGASA